MTIKATKEAYISVASEDQGLVKREASDEKWKANKELNLEWMDSFYDKEPDVLAVFDIDYPFLRNKMKCSMVYVSLIFSVYFGMYWTFVIGTDMQDDVNEPYATVNVVAVLAMLSMCMLLAIKRMQYQADNVMGMHVAVTKYGLRKDMVNFPMGLIFRTQTLMPFGEIKSIAVSRGLDRCCTTARNVVVTAKSDGTSNMIPGVRNAEALVDLVQDMMQVECVKNAI